MSRAFIFINSLVEMLCHMFTKLPFFSVILNGFNYFDIKTRDRLIFTKNMGYLLL